MTKMETNQVPPPSSEEWDRLPLSAKIQIVAIVFFATWQAQLAYAWLKLAGVDGANDA
jgi:hypothetical protein